MVTSFAIDPHSAAAARIAGATAEQVHLAHSVCMNLLWYGKGLALGCTHAELCSVDALGIDWFDYLEARECGISHDRAVAAHRAGVAPLEYDRARRAGASDRRVRAAFRANVDLWSYSSALKAGAKDREVRAAAADGLNMLSYAQLRTVATDAQAREALLELGDWVTDYVDARRAGQRHQPALRAWAEYIPF